MPQTATNPETGETLELIDGRWVPQEKPVTATNPKTGETLTLKDGRWIPDERPSEGSSVIDYIREKTPLGLVMGQKPLTEREKYEQDIELQKRKAETDKNAAIVAGGTAAATVTAPLLAGLIVPGTATVPSSLVGASGEALTTTGTAPSILSAFLRSPLAKEAGKQALKGAGLTAGGSLLWKLLHLGTGD